MKLEESVETAPNFWSAAHALRNEMHIFVEEVQWPHCGTAAASTASNYWHLAPRFLPAPAFQLRPHRKDVQVVAN
jgi:hypothetical protein